MPSRPRRQYRHLPAFVLLALAERPLHGGAIHAALIERMPSFRADTGAVYRTLQKLARDGEVRAGWDTSRPGAARKVYRLTAAGWRKLDVWQADVARRLANLRYFLAAYRRVLSRRAGRRDA